MRSVRQIHVVLGALVLLAGISAVPIAILATRAPRGTEQRWAYVIDNENQLTELDAWPSKLDGLTTLFLERRCGNGFGELHCWSYDNGILTEEEYGPTSDSGERIGRWHCHETVSGKKVWLDRWFWYGEEVKEGTYRLRAGQTGIHVPGD